MKLTLAIILLTIIPIIHTTNGNTPPIGAHVHGVRHVSSQNGGTRNGAIQNNGGRSGTHKSSTTGRWTGSANGFKTGTNRGIPRNVATQDGIHHKIRAGTHHKIGGGTQADIAHGGRKFGKVIDQSKSHHHDHDHYRPGHRRHSGIAAAPDSGTGGGGNNGGGNTGNENNGGGNTDSGNNSGGNTDNENNGGGNAGVPVINEGSIIIQKPVTPDSGQKDDKSSNTKDSNVSCIVDNDPCSTKGDSNCCSSFCVVLEGKEEGTCQDKAGAAAIASQKRASDPSRTKVIVVKGDGE